MIDLKAIKARADKASPGPWFIFGRKGTEVLDGHPDYDSSEYIVPSNDMHPEKMRPENAEFICHAREDIPALIARVEELEKQFADWLPPQSMTPEELKQAIEDCSGASPSLLGQAANKP